MRVSIYGEAYKVVPKKFGKIKDMLPFFDKVWISTRLSKGERERLEEQLGKIEIYLFHNKLKLAYKEFPKPIKELIGGSKFDSIVKIVRRSEPSYTVVRFANKVECRMDDSWYRLAKKTKGIKTESINRSY